jgi:hypothetical protein
MLGSDDSHELEHSSRPIREIAPAFEGPLCWVGIHPLGPVYLDGDRAG